MEVVAVYLFLLLLGIYAGVCHSGRGPLTIVEPPPPDTGLTELVRERQGFVTALVRKRHMSGPPAAPPEELFSLVYYPTAIGKMVAYPGKVPQDGQLHPAVIWIDDGFSNSIGYIKTGSPFREAGIVMMYPALRGGSGNPGYVEYGFGELDDMVAAAAFLAKQPGIDPDRIYLGGAGVGGTGKDHVAAVAPVCRLLAAAVLKDTSSQQGVFEPGEMSSAPRP